jgi:hypothetical protein
MDRYLCLDAVAMQDVLRQLLQLPRSS